MTYMTYIRIVHYPNLSKTADYPDFRFIQPSGRKLVYNYEIGHVPFLHPI
jgi:hypothetical protein